MKRWGNAIFPLCVLFVLVGLTFWLRYATEFAQTRNDGAFRHDPDYIITNSVLRKIDDQGHLQYVLKTKKAHHYPDDDTTDFTDPNLVQYFPDAPTVTITAHRGHSSSEGEQIDLYEDVLMVRAATARQEALHLKTPSVTLWPDKDQAYAQESVLISQGKSWVRGMGLKANSRLQTYRLESNARALIEPQYFKNSSKGQP